MISATIARAHPGISRSIPAITVVLAMSEVVTFPSTSFAITLLLLLGIFPALLPNVVSLGSAFFAGSLVFATLVISAITSGNLGQILLLLVVISSILIFIATVSVMSGIASAYLAMSTAISFSALMLHSSGYLLFVNFVLTATVVVLGYVQEFSLKLDGVIVAIVNFLTVKPVLAIIAVLSANVGTGNGLLL